MNPALSAAIKRGCRVLPYPLALLSGHFGHHKKGWKAYLATKCNEKRLKKFGRPKKSGTGTM